MCRGFPRILKAVDFASIPFALWPLPTNLSATGRALDQHLLLNLWIAIALLAFAHLILFAGFFLRQRRHLRNRTLLKYLPLAALTLLFGFLAIRSEHLWAATFYTGPDLSALQIEGTGMQFAWYFRYPGCDANFGRTRPELISPAEGNPVGIDPGDARGADDFVTTQLVVPANREIDLRLHAQDVIHGFFVPALRLKQNAVPGEDFHVHFTATTPGTYAILCTQLCGLGHYRMTANLQVLLPEEYAKWVASHEVVTQ